MSLRIVPKLQGGRRARGVDRGNARDRTAGPEIKVLLVDCDLDELDVSAYALRRDGFAVIESSHATQALTQFRIERPDLVAIRLELPPPGGVELLRQIRAEHHTPVLMMITRNDGQDAVRCIEFGANDFITKPYAVRELALRIRAILVRPVGLAREEFVTPLAHGELRLEPETHEVTQGSLRIQLTPTEFWIFFALVKNAEHVVPANRLLTYVRGSQGGAANSLRSHICHLRRKLGLGGGAEGAIASVPTVGYVFRGPAAREPGTPNELTFASVAAWT